MLKLEILWIEGKLDHVVVLDDDQTKISWMQPWGGSQALIATDGLFRFGADLTNEK